MFDVYLTWARIEKSPSLATTFLSRAPIIVQYFFFLGLNALATLAHHLTIRALASVLAPAPRGLKQNGNNPTTTTTESPLSTPSTPVHTSPPSQITNTQSQLSPTSASMLSPPRLSRQGSYDTPSAGGGFSTAYSTGNDNHAVLPTSQGSFPPPPLRRASTAPIQSIQPLPPPSPASPTAISTALLVSSCAKLFPILLVIWGPDGSGIASQTPADSSVGTSRVTPGNVSQHALYGIAPAATTTTSSSGIAGSPSPASSTLLESLIQMLPQSVPTSYLANFVELTGSLFSLGAADTHLVLLSNIEALYVLLGCGYLRAVTLAVAGLMARWTVQRVILGAIGVS